jgi:hypothetical protein
VPVPGDGIGIRPDTLPRVFNLFVQAAQALRLSHREPRAGALPARAACRYTVSIGQRCASLSNTWPVCVP